MISQVAGRLAAEKIKAFTPQLKGALSKPFLASAEVLRFPKPQEQVQSRFSAYFTRSRREIFKAQRLRYRVFSEAYGASFKAPFGLDRDRYDRHCLHLVVKDNHSGELVGYTRLLPAERAQRIGGFYSSGEFQLAMLTGLQGRIAEVGRTCIHPDYRGGVVITVLWGRLSQYLLDNQVEHLIGCASVALNEGYNLAALDRQIQARHLTASHQRVQPRLPLPVLPGDAEQPGGKMPALLKAYLRMGARIGGAPCWDPDFNCIDYFILLAVEDMPERYVQHFLSPAQAV